MTQSSDIRNHRKEAEKLLKSTHIRMFDCVQYVTAYLPGELDDWPSNIQDLVYAALERMAHRAQLPLKVVMAYCNRDIDAESVEPKYYVHIIASEIVAVDVSTTRMQ